jgi:hypothetical protein
MAELLDPRLKHQDILYHKVPPSVQLYEYN